MPTGFISFPGIQNCIRVIAPRTNGCVPDAGVLYCVPQNTAPSGTGTLAFGFNGVSVSWQNALADLSTLQTTTSGHFESIKILDSRWMWAKHYITAAYNVYGNDGNIISATSKTLAQLISILFSQIGVTVDTSLITSTENPQVVWDHSQCIFEIDSLLIPRGYVVSLQLDDTAKIFPTGTGATLPTNTDIINISYTLDPPEVPNVLTLVGGKTLVQSKLKCVPVGRDIDGSWKPVASLSYCPGVGVTGWDGLEMKTFAYLTSPVAQQLALDTVGKCYQATTQADGTQNIGAGSVNYVPGEITVSDFTQLFPLKRKLIATQNNQFGQSQYQESYVEVTTIDTTKQPPKEGDNSAPFSRIDSRDWDLIEEWGIVAFKEPMLKGDGGTPVKIVFGDCYLNCTYSIDNGGQTIKDRFTRQQSLGGYGEDQEYVEEIQRTLICNYTSPPTISSITDNESTLNTTADGYLNQAVNKYQTKDGTTVTYRGIYQFGTDGANLQILWNCNTQSQSPWSTIVAQYNEGIPRLNTQEARGIRREQKRRRNVDQSRVDTQRRNRERFKY